MPRISHSARCAEGLRSAEHFRVSTTPDDRLSIFISKLSSKMEKHKSDLRVLALKLTKDTARRRPLTDGQTFLNDPSPRPQIEEIWPFIYQEPLYVEPVRLLRAHTRTGRSLGE